MSSTAFSLPRVEADRGVPTEREEASLMRRDPPLEAERRAALRVEVVLVSWSGV